MKVIKAYLHANRVSDVIAALKASASWSSGEHNLTIYLVKGSLLPVDQRERHYSVELGDEVVNEFQLELMCDDDRVDELVAIVRRTGRTGQANAGWVYVTDVLQALPID